MDAIHQLVYPFKPLFIAPLVNDDQPIEYCRIQTISGPIMALFAIAQQDYEIAESILEYENN